VHAQAQLAKDYTANMARVYDEVLQRGALPAAHPLGQQPHRVADPRGSATWPHSGHIEAKQH
jgi:hypothetical protein